MPERHPLYPPFTDDPAYWWLVAVVDFETGLVKYREIVRLTVDPADATTIEAAVGLHGEAYRQVALAALPVAVGTSRRNTLLVCPFVGSLLYAGWEKDEARDRNARYQRDYRERQRIKRETERELGQ